MNITTWVQSPFAVAAVHSLNLGGLDEMARGLALQLRWHANYEVYIVMID